MCLDNWTLVVGTCSYDLEVQCRAMHFHVPIFWCAEWYNWSFLVSLTFTKPKRFWIYHQPTLTYLHSVGIDQAQCGVLLVTRETCLKAPCNWHGILFSVPPLIVRMVCNTMYSLLGHCLTPSRRDTRPNTKYIIRFQWKNISHVNYLTCIASY